VSASRDWPGLASRHAPVLFGLGALMLVLAFGAVFNADGAFFRGYTHSATLGQLAGTWSWPAARRS